VIGPVAALDVGWYEQRPLFGRQVVVTRAREQVSTLSAALRNLGARPIEVPVIRIDKPADGGTGLRSGAAGLQRGDYDWVIFTSANGVGPFVRQLHDARDFGRARLAAIGPGTAESLGAWGLRADLVPERYVAEGLLEAFPDRPAGGGRVLLPRAAEARDVLPKGLEARGWRVDMVEAYRTVTGSPAPEVLLAAARADAICFTASSTVTRYLEVAGEDAVPPVVACIGPVTAATARDAGIAVTTVASEHTIDGLLDALCAFYSKADVPRQ
jgi:uroporphyrinogen III methyltransferase/synthase